MSTDLVNGHSNFRGTFLDLGGQRRQSYERKKLFEHERDLLCSKKNIKALHFGTRGRDRLLMWHQELDASESSVLFGPLAAGRRPKKGDRNILFVNSEEYGPQYAGLRPRLRCR